MTNNLPVSLLPYLSKICEKVFFFVLFFSSFCFKGHRNQNWFPSIVMPLAYIVHKIHEAIEEGSEMKAVFLIYLKCLILHPPLILNNSII